MLKQLQVRNFRSLSDATFEPRAIELIIGPNGSGKTALCKVMQFVGLCGTKVFDMAARACFGESCVANEKFYYEPTHISLSGDLTVSDEEECQFEYELCFRKQKPEWPPKQYEIDRVSERLTLSGCEYGSGLVVLEARGAETLYLNEEHYRIGAKRPYDLVHTGSCGSGVRNRPRGKVYGACDLFARYLGQWRYFWFEPSRFTRNMDGNDQYALMPDGTNLRCMLKRLYLEEQSTMNRFLTGALGRSGDPESPSRLAAIGYGLMFATEPQSLVIIEEPENGLHVSLYKEVMRLAEEAADRGVQVIFTSHSPYFIDLFDGRLDAITLCAPSENGSRIEKADPEWLKTVLRKFDLGEAYFHGLMRRPATKGVVN